VVGPTASGKSDLALAIAERMPVEILVADSRQVYRGLDIGTAKPDSAARARVPHHLVDLVDPDEPFTVARWVARARTLLPEVAARARTPLLVGGAGLYVAALVDGHDHGSQVPDARFRASLLDELHTAGLDALVDRLASDSPQIAASIDRSNPRRVIRALERLAGGAGEPTAVAYAGHVALLGLQRPREVLYRRIEERARWLFENGLLDEVRALLRAGFGPDLRPMTGHGYAEAMHHVAGEWTLARAIEVTARRTRQYAKRQLTWFRRDPRIVWLDAGEGPADDPALVEAALRALTAAEKPA